MMPTIQEAFAKMSTEALSAIARNHIRALLFHIVRNDGRGLSIEECQKKTRQIEALVRFPIVQCLPDRDRDEIEELVDSCLDLIHEELIKDMPAELAWRKITS